MVQLDDRGLGRRLRSLREQRGLRQSDLAGASLSAAYVSMIEHGRRRPSARVIAELAGRLDIDPDELTAAEDDPSLVPLGPLPPELVMPSARASALLTHTASALLLGRAQEALSSAEAVVRLLPGDDDAMRLSIAHLASAQARLQLDEPDAARDSLRAALAALDGAAVDPGDGPG